MSINLQLILGHELNPEELSCWPETLESSDSLRSTCAALHSALASRWRRLEPTGESSRMMWEGERPEPTIILAAWSAERAVALKWCGFSVYAGRRAFAMIHIEKYGAFVHGDVGVQQPLRTACAALARTIGQREAIYTPDSSYDAQRAFQWVLSGASLREVEHRLREEIGPPAPDIAHCEIVVSQTGGAEVSGWYLDDFGG